MRTEYFKGVIWPRQTEIIKPIENEGQNLYRYAIVGILVTDKPIEKFENKNEIFLDGRCFGIADLIEFIKSREPAYRVGDATSVLCGLEHL